MSQTSAPKEEPAPAKTFDNEENKRSISQVESVTGLQDTQNRQTKSTLRSASDGMLYSFLFNSILANLGTQLADLKTKRKRVQQDVR